MNELGDISFGDEVLIERCELADAVNTHTQLIPSNSAYHSQ